MQKGRVWLSVLRWLLVCWVIVFWRMDYRSLIDDEAHYAQLTREMLRTGNWLVPTLNGAPFIDKPILFHWLQGLAFSLFGESGFSASLPSALAAVCLFITTAALGRRLLGDRVAERAWLMLATIPASFVLSRVGYLDMLFTACLFGSVSCLLLAALHGRRGLEQLGYALLVLAVMTKGPVAIALVAVFLMLCFLAGGACRLAVGRLDWRTGLLLTVLGSAPWFVWMHGRFGDRFVHDYLLEGHLQYLAPRASASSNASAFYLEMFVTVFFPWSLVTLGSVVDDLRALRRGVRPPPAVVMLWLWIATVLLLFTVARFRVDRYIFPAAPACCLLAARAWVQARVESDAARVAVTRASIFAVAGLLFAAGIVLAFKLPTLGLGLPATAFLLPLVLVAGGGWMLGQMLRHRFRPPPVLDGPLGVLVTVYALVVAVGLPILEKTRPVKAVGAWLQMQSAGSDAVGLYGLDRWQPMLRYYGRRVLQRLDDEAAVRKFLAGPGPRWLVTRRDALAALGPDAPAAPEIALAVPAVVGSSGQGVRRQIWDDVVVLRKPADASASGADAQQTRPADSAPAVETAASSPPEQTPPMAPSVPTEVEAVAALDRPVDPEGTQPSAPPEPASLQPRTPSTSDNALAPARRRTPSSIRRPGRRVQRDAADPVREANPSLPLLLEQK